MNYTVRTLSYSVTTQSYKHPTIIKMNRFDQDYQELAHSVRLYGVQRNEVISVFGKQFIHNMKSGFPIGSIFPRDHWHNTLEHAVDGLKTENWQQLANRIIEDPFSNSHYLGETVFYVRPLTKDESSFFWCKRNPEAAKGLTLEQLNEIDYLDPQWNKIPDGAISMSWNQAFVNVMDLHLLTSYYGFVIALVAHETNMMPDWVVANLGTVALHQDDDEAEILDQPSKDWLPTFYIADDFKLFESDFDLNYFILQ